MKTTNEIQIRPRQVSGHRIDPVSRHQEEEGKEQPLEIPLLFPGDSAENPTGCTAESHDRKRNHAKERCKDLQIEFTHNALFALPQAFSGSCLACSLRLSKADYPHQQSRQSPIVLLSTYYIQAQIDCEEKKWNIK